MTAYERLKELLGLLAEKLPQVECRESYAPKNAGRLPGKAVIAGQVGSESTEGSKWGARLDLAVYLPRGWEISQGEEILAGISRVAGENYTALSGVKREGFAPDKDSGLVMARCFLEFAGGGEGAAQSVTIGGVEHPASGWEIKIEPGKALTAIGEAEPFATVGGCTYSVKLEGIDTKGLERLAGFTVRLGQQVFSRCRWKSLDETGRSGIFISSQREEGGG